MAFLRSLTSYSRVWRVNSETYFSQHIRDAINANPPVTELIIADAYITPAKLNFLLDILQTENQFTCVEFDNCTFDYFATSLLNSNNFPIEKIYAESFYSTAAASCLKNSESYLITFNEIFQSYHILNHSYISLAMHYSNEAIRIGIISWEKTVKFSCEKATDLIIKRNWSDARHFLLNALSATEHAWRLPRENAFFKKQFELSYEIAEISLLMNDYDTARTYTSQCLKLFKCIKNPSLREDNQCNYLLRLSDKNFTPANTNLSFWQSPFSMLMNKDDKILEPKEIQEQRKQFIPTIRRPS